MTCALLTSINLILWIPYVHRPSLPFFFWRRNTFARKMPEMALVLAQEPTDPSQSRFVILCHPVGASGCESFVSECSVF